MQTIDFFLQKSCNNDEFARVVRGRNRSEQETKSTISKWRSCEHLFVKVRESEYIGAFHSSDCGTIPARFECVHCGLTNRLIDTEAILDERNSIYDSLLCRKKVTDETTEWKHQEIEPSGKNLLSEEVIRTTHPSILFNIATELCFAQEIKATKENIFEVMKELDDMETTAEKLKISTVVHASALIERYKQKHELYTSV